MSDVLDWRAENLLWETMVGRVYRWRGGLWCVLARAHRELANLMADALVESDHQAEVHAGLRKLLEAKDCFVRASLGSK